MLTEGLRSPFLFAKCWILIFSEICDLFLWLILQNLAAEKTYNNLDITLEQALKHRQEVTGHTLIWVYYLTNLTLPVSSLINILTCYYKSVVHAALYWIYQSPHS